MYLTNFYFYYLENTMTEYVLLILSSLFKRNVRPDLTKKKNTFTE